MWGGVGGGGVSVGWSGVRENECVGWGGVRGSVWGGMG